MGDLRFIQVGELAKGMSGENRLPTVDALSSRSLQLFFEDDTSTRVTFTSAHDLRWEVVEGPATGTCGEETYAATCLRDGIFFVDYVSRARQATSVSLVLDLNVDTATVVMGTLPTKTEVEKGLFARADEGSDLTDVRVEFLRAAVGRRFRLDEHHHVPTTELVGKRVKYVYSRTETYEHIYLNAKLYTWQCLAGSEKGLADTDRCHYYKIDERLYLFVWREKIVPTLGVVLVDWRRMKTSGKLFGYESSDFGRLTNTQIGAHATLLNETTYV